MIEDCIIEKIRAKIGSDIEVNDSQVLSGGSINKVCKLSTSIGDYCVKINDTDKFPQMFNKEANGLRILTKQSSFTVPEIIDQDEVNGLSYLLLSYIDSGNKRNAFWQLFGLALANMHKKTNHQFGLDHDNFIGSLVQKNSFKSTWLKFFVENRLTPQIEMAFNDGTISKSFVNDLDGLIANLDLIFPDEPPSLLHGDLWSGNFMADSKGNPALFDPAVYYGHREVDIAMTKLFGGFDNQMYTSYNEHFPLESGWENRLDLYNLYPLLVHLNLFGRSYLSQIKSIVSKFN